MLRTSNINAVEATIEFATDTVDISDLKFDDSMVSFVGQRAVRAGRDYYISGGMTTGFNGMHGKILSFVLAQAGALPH